MAGLARVATFPWVFRVLLWSAGAIHTWVTIIGCTMATLDPRALAALAFHRITSTGLVKVSEDLVGMGLRAIIKPPDLAPAWGNPSSPFAPAFNRFAGYGGGFYGKPSFPSPINPTGASTPEGYGQQQSQYPPPAAQAGASEPLATPAEA